MTSVICRPTFARYVDEIDFSICRALFMDSRQTFAEIGKAIGLTPQAVHRRVQDLIEAGVIKGTVARPTTYAMGRMWVIVHGWSKGRSMKEVSDRLSKSPDIMVMMMASGNYLYVHGAVSTANDLANFASFVQREASISDPTVAIVNLPALDPDKAMTPLDLQIMRSLSKDSRRPVGEVAEEVGISVKTARKRIERLQKEGLVNFSIHWNPDTLGDTLSNIHITVKDGIEREKVAMALIKRCAQYTLRTYSFSNLPNQYIITMWTKNVRDLQQVCDDLEGEGIFDSVVMHIMHGIRYYEEINAKRWAEMMPIRKPKVSR